MPRPTKRQAAKTKTSDGDVQEPAKSRRRLTSGTKTKAAANVQTTYRRSKRIANQNNGTVMSTDKTIRSYENPTSKSKSKTKKRKLPTPKGKSKQKRKLFPKNGFSFFRPEGQ